MNRKQLWKENYRKSIDYIDIIMNSIEDSDKETVFLTNWLYNFEGNPYSLFHVTDYGDYMETASGFEMLCHIIHHALVDDGEICFPVIRNHPCIAFINKNDDVQWYTETELHINRQFGKPLPEVTFLKDSYEFVEKFEEYMKGKK